MWEKQQPSSFKIPENVQEYQQVNYIPEVLWAFKSKLQIIHAATYIALFLRDRKNCFFNMF